MDKDFSTSDGSSAASTESSTQPKSGATLTDEELRHKLDEARRMAGLTLSSAVRDPSPAFDGSLPKMTEKERRERSGTWMSDEETAKVERDRREHVLSVRARKSGLTEEYLSGAKSLATFPIANDDDREAILAVKAWVGRRASFDITRDDKPGLFIHGPVGVGKSGLVQCAIAASLVQSAATYVTKIDMISTVQEAFSSSADVSERSAVAFFAENPRLAIDDIDKGQFSKFVMRVMWAIFDFRMRNHLPTIITFNDRDAGGLAGLYKHLEQEDPTTADAIVDRIRDMCEDVPMTGRSKRR